MEEDAVEDQSLCRLYRHRRLVSAVGAVVEASDADRCRAASKWLKQPLRQGQVIERIAVVPLGGLNAAAQANLAWIVPTVD